MYGKADLNDLFSISSIYTAHCQRFSSTYSFPGETHDFWELVMVLDGELGVTAGQNLIILNKGQAILHEPMEFHRLWSEGNSTPEIAIISFSCKNMPPLKTRLYKINSLNRREAALLIKSIRSVFFTDDVSITGIKNPFSFEYQITTKKLELFLLDILSENITDVMRPMLQSAKNYSEIIRFLENNLDKALNISDIAKMCNMSEVNLKKTFNKYSGIGIKRYFNQLKMNEAISLLRSGYSVMETAAALGFSDQNYFSAAFKRIIGKAPSEFKKMYQF